MNELPVCVFIADDDRFLPARTFAHYSPECHVQFAKDGLVLLAELERTNPQPALILLDLNMPRLSGFETLEYLRAHPQYGQTPIVSLTMSKAEIGQQRAKKLGTDMFITKPIGGAALGQTVLHSRAKYLQGKCF